jgi:hypothetical protein
MLVRAWAWSSPVRMTFFSLTAALANAPSACRASFTRAALRSIKPIAVAASSSTAWLAYHAMPPDTAATSAIGIAILPRIGG